MSLIHHLDLRVNAPGVDDVDAMEIYAESGWAAGPHPDSDPDDPATVPAVLPPKSKTPRAAATSPKD